VHTQKGFGMILSAMLQMALMQLATALVADAAQGPISPGILSGLYVVANEVISLTVSGIDPQPGTLRTIAATITDVNSGAGDGYRAHSAPSHF
jgi:hypothetical protein